MTQVALVYPLLVQVALTFVLLLWTARLRTSGLTTNQVRAEDVALGQPNWPPRTTQISNAFHNQLQVPVLFYVLVLLLMQTRLSDIVQVVLAWAFVLLRLAHAYIHTTSNDVQIRGPVFGIGVVVLIAMWVWFAVRLIGASV